MGNLRLWERDRIILQAVGRAPHSNEQLARLTQSPVKKITERTGHLYRAGHHKRVPAFQPAKQGKAGFLYFTGRPPERHAELHTMMISELSVQTVEWQRIAPQYDIAFYFGHELHISAALLPDAAITITKGKKTMVIYCEIDNGTTPIIRHTNGYSLQRKFTEYAGLWDSGACERDWPGSPRGFRVAMIVPSPARLRHVQHLAIQEELDFILLTTFEATRQGIHHPIWVAPDGRTMDLLGKPREQ